VKAGDVILVAGFGGREGNTPFRVVDERSGEFRGDRADNLVELDTFACGFGTKQCGVGIPVGAFRGFVRRS
jgi:hypothetical protein